MANITKVTSDKKAKFLLALAETGSATAAAARTKISRQEWYRTRAEDEEFAAAWKEAAELGTDALEDEAVRRAHEGTLRPVFQGGRKVGSVREFSDTLLIFTLKGRRPERWKDRVATEHSGPNGGAIEVSDVRERLASRLARLAAGSGKG